MVLNFKRNRRHRRNPGIHLSSAIVNQSSNETCAGSVERSFNESDSMLPLSSSTAAPSSSPSYSVLSSHAHNRPDEHQAAETLQVEDNVENQSHYKDAHAQSNTPIYSITAVEPDDDTSATASLEEPPFNPVIISEMESDAQQQEKIRQIQDPRVVAAFIETDDIPDTEAASSPTPFQVDPCLAGVSVSADVRHRSSPCPKEREECSAEDIKLSQTLSKLLLRRFKKGTFTAIISLYGKARFTLDSYEHLVAMLNEYEVLPSPTNMRQVVFPFLVKNCFVGSKNVLCPTKQVMKDSFYSSSVRRPQLSTSAINNRNKRNQAVVVLPSSWAKLDIRSYHVLREIACIKACRCFPNQASDDVRFESTPRVRLKSTWKTQPFSLWVSRKGLPVQASVGTRLSLHMFGDHEVPSNIQELFNLRLVRKENRGHNCKAFNADVLCTFMVAHSTDSRLFLQDGLEPPANQPVTHQDFLEKCVKYLVSKSITFSTKASEDGSSEEVNDTDGQRANNRKRKRPSTPDDDLDEAALKLRPGDLITFLTTPNSSEGCALLVYVNRFWPSRLQNDRQLIGFFHLGDNGEVESHCAPSFGTPSFVSHSTESGRGGNGSDELRKCCTTGKLDSGEKFYRYRILL